jgi:uncharacterized protein (DUF3820 family)
MTRQEALLFKMPFGKYKNETLGFVYMENKKYLEWLFEQIDYKEHPKLFEALQHMVN